MKPAVTRGAKRSGARAKARADSRLAASPSSGGTAQSVALALMAAERPLPGEKPAGMAVGSHSEP